MNLAAINANNEGGANGVLGIVFTEVGDDFLRAEMEIAPCTQQPFGLLHGGVSCVLAESLGSSAGVLACDEGYVVVGVDINATHLNGIRSGKVIGTARPLKLGRRMQFWHIDIESEEGRPICSARLSTAVMKVNEADTQIVQSAVTNT